MGLDVHEGVDKRAADYMLRTTRTSGVTGSRLLQHTDVLWKNINF